MLTEPEQDVPAIEDFNQHYLLTAPKVTNFCLMTHNQEIDKAYKAMLNNRGTDLEDIYSVSPPKFDRWANPHN